MSMSSILRKLKVWEEDKQSSREKTTNMMRNGATVLKELIGSSNGKYNPYRVFSVEELQLATNNFDRDRNFKFDGSDYKVFEGLWQERLISVVKYNKEVGIYGFDKLCINNMVYASQMVHNHIVKLIGCCLETENPILVFEYFQNGTLADRLYGTTPPQPHFQPLLLKHRLKIAMDIGNALAYLHLGFRRPIIFRGFKTSLIMFSEENVAKLFDFSLSIAIPEGETHVSDEVLGTYGFAAPEYVETGVLNEKADVFSFGIFLLELLSGQRAVDHARSGDDTKEEALLLDYVKKYFEENRLNRIVDRLIMEDISCPEKRQLLHDLVPLILECSNLSPVDRPTMVEITKKLRQMYLSCM